MVELKTPDEIDKMRAAGAVVADALRAMRAAADAGVTLLELDAVGVEVLARVGATSPFLNYQPSWAPSPFPGVACVSVNDAVVHGIPNRYRLRDGDLVSIDFGAILDGWAGDAAVSFVVGKANDADTRLIAATEAALEAGIAAARVGGKLGDIAAAIGSSARRAGYGILDGHGGHGIGRTMHEDPHVPNEGRRGRGMVLRAGLVLALEPMLIADGTDDYRHDSDGWTLRTVTGARAAHVEHTVAITERGPVILTG